MTGPGWLPGRHLALAVRMDHGRRLRLCGRQLRGLAMLLMPCPLLLLLLHVEMEHVVVHWGIRSTEGKVF